MFYQSSPVPVLLYAEVVASLRMQKEVLERAFFGLSVLYKVQTHGLGPKMAIFPSFFFRQYKPGKCLL